MTVLEFTKREGTTENDFVALCVWHEDGGFCVRASGIMVISKVYELMVARYCAFINTAIICNLVAWK